ncbi:MAG: DUF1732 domain-containing protein, partial [Firmicutes bacterium]|nr:DUF1732 domain-containing protein [Bacillota bacterium]
MIRSMTGFGRGEASDPKRTVTAEIRSVNHRYCEITVKMPRRFSFAEEPLKALIKEKAKRGKIELSVSSLQNEMNADEAENAVRLDLALAKQYDKSLRLLAKELDMDIAVNDVRDETAMRHLALIAGMPDVLKVAPAEDDEEQLLATLSEAVMKALDSLSDMRAVEGKKLADDILARGETIRETAAMIAKRAPLVKEIYLQKLRARIAELIGDAVKELPEERILTEAALFADKSDITEELVRLDSHTKQLAAILNGAGDESAG